MPSLYPPRMPERSTGEWRFRADDLSPHRRVVVEGGSVVLSCLVTNTGSTPGTVYVRFMVANAYDVDAVVFDSDRDLTINERQCLRIVDIGVGERRPVTCEFTVPLGLTVRFFEIRVEVWNPHRLLSGPYPFLFHEIGWIGGFEVLSAPDAASASRVFISYSWDSKEHREWVAELVGELQKRNLNVTFDGADLRPGQDVALFMENGIAQSDVVLLVCTGRYTNKANERVPGGVGTETIVSASEYALRAPADRARFIPIVRDNDLPSGRKVPRYLGGALYVDMSGKDWRAEPMRRLVDAIRSFH